MDAGSRKDNLKTSAIVLPGIISTAQKLGVDIKEILRQRDIPIDLEHITRSVIDLRHVHSIVMALEEAAGHPAIGLHAGEDFDFEFLPHLKTFIMSSSTLRQAFEATIPIQKLISPLLVLELEEAGDDAAIKLKPGALLSEEDERHYTEMVFSTIRTLTNRLMKKITRPKAVHFRHGRSDISPLYESFFSCRVVLNASENIIMYERAVMDIPLPGGFPEIRRQAGDIVNQQLADSPFQDGLTEEVRRLLTLKTDLLNASVDQIARFLNMSVRTLQRRLSESGYDLRDLRDQVRFELAAQALRSRTLSMDEISEKLGFSDRHSFTRAFKRWSGISPSGYRKALVP